MPIRDTLETAVGRQIRRLAQPLPRRRRRVVHRPNGRQGEAADWWRGDPHWFPGGTPPRLRNRVTPLIDGDAYFTALYRALTQAQQYVYIIGWSLTPAVPLLREDRDAMVRTRLEDVLQEVARRAAVRVLLWDGALALFPPTRHQVEAIRRTLLAHVDGDIRCHLDASAPFTHCHHQKAVVVDGQVAFVGGMDLTTLSGDRWDTPQHPLRVGPSWHDVQVCIEGEAVADVERNFRQRWEAVTGEDDLPYRDAYADPTWQTPVQIVRTLPEGVYRFAEEGEFGIHYTYVQALRRARRLIYLENQYLWSADIMEALAAAICRERAEPFRIVIVLPARADRGKWDNDRHVERLRGMDAGRGIVSVYCPYAWGAGPGRHPFAFRPTYVHAKVAIIDDEWLSVGSANLNDRGLVTDGEMNALVHDPEVARRLRIDLWAEHLALDPGEVAQADPIALVDETWAHRARMNVESVQHGDRPLICPAHPYELGSMPGSWLLEEAEVLSLEH